MSLGLPGRARPPQESGTPSRAFLTPLGNRAADVAVAPSLLLVVGLVFLSTGWKGATTGLVLLALAVTSPLVILYVAYHVTPFLWRLVLDAESLWIGCGENGWRHAYQDVRFLTYSQAQGPPSVGIVGPTAHLGIQVGRRHYVVALRPADAEAALQHLRARCPNASGRNDLGESFLARDPGAAAVGLRRLRWHAIWTQTLGLLGGALGLAAAGYVSFFPEVGLAQLGLGFLILGLGALVYTIRASLRARRSLADVERSSRR
jgi:hypothetical protein